MHIPAVITMQCSARGHFDSPMQHDTFTPHADRGSLKPTLKELQRLGLFSLAATKWEELAIEFDFDNDGDEVSRIEYEKKGDGERCCRAAMMMWLQGKGRLEPRTWATLHGCLIQAGANEAARSVQKSIINEGDRPGDYTRTCTTQLDGFMWIAKSLWTWGVPTYT